MASLSRSASCLERAVERLLSSSTCRSFRWSSRAVREAASSKFRTLSRRVCSNSWRSNSFMLRPCSSLWHCASKTARRPSSGVRKGGVWGAAAFGTVVRGVPLPLPPVPSATSSRREAKMSAEATSTKRSERGGSLTTSGCSSAPPPALAGASPTTAATSFLGPGTLSVSLPRPSLRSPTVGAPPLSATCGEVSRVSAPEESLGEAGGRRT
mmetsp:Transcript_80459/g.172155  ORF Transcript_80459/g.172155 Transcript_80459/m.172155 type:complete len:211 (+) Transcript_80459:542-1174(+)